MHDGSAQGDSHPSLLEIISMAFILAVLVSVFTKQPKCDELPTQKQKKECHAAKKR